MSVQGGPVAIVGISCRFPEADSPERFRDRLDSGHDAIRPPDEQRVRQTGEPTGIGYLPMGYLDRIDLFDHDFFGISLREAEAMDPHQRLLLHLAHEAIENAGYAPRGLRGSSTGVFLGTHQTDYQTLYQDFDPQQILGSLPSASAARLAYAFDLHGPALVVDTACSSSLAAVVLAVDRLRACEVDLALAGGISVRPVLPRRAGHEPLRGIDSPDGTCRPFDVGANGAVGGEGGGIVVLKRLADAMADRDTVYAVITGTALNHNGHRAVSMAAPSPQAQASVITAALRDADADPTTIGYVECHGSATPLGDAVEIDGLRRALSAPGAQRRACAIGSVKGNIGHLDAAAGMAGLLKVVLSVRDAVHFPTVNFTAPNPQVDLGDLLTVPTRTTPWPGPEGTPRRAGLSSFGLTGTNVHVVVEQAPPPSPTSAPGDPECHLVTLSAKSASALDSYRRHWVDFLRTTTHPLAAVAHVMNRGRDDHRYRLAFAVSSVEELQRALSTAVVPDRPVPVSRPLVVLFSGGDHPDPASRGEEVVRQHSLHALLDSLGLSTTRFAGSGTGKSVIRAIRGVLRLDEAVQAATGTTDGVSIDHSRLRAAVTGFEREGALLVELGAGAQLSRAIRPLTDLPIVAFADEPGRDHLLDKLALLYTLGATLDWDRHYHGADLPRVPAPTHPFEPVRCWCRPIGTPAARGTGGTNHPVVDPTRSFDVQDGHDVERRLAAVWADVLKVPAVREDSDYFALGGTSIAGITVLREVQREFGVELGFTDLYDHSTMGKLAQRIRRGLPTGDRAVVLAPIPPVSRLDPLSLSFGQEQLWYLDRLNPGSPLYNIPVDLRLSGRVDPVALAAALGDIADRHEVLRTRLPSSDGEPFVLVSAPPVRLPITDLGALPAADRARRADELIAQAANHPFDLAVGPLWRTRLLTLAPDDHVLLLTWHHIVFDGWSPSVFFPELAALYRARLDGRPHGLPALPVQYADYAAWQRARWATGSAPALHYWKHRLAGLERPELPLDRPRPPVREFGGDVVEFTVDAELADRVRDFGKRHGVTSFVTMLAALTALLHRWAGWRDVAVGVATSGRNHPDTHGLIGYFNNALPFRTEVTDDLSFEDLVARCARTAAGVLDHDIPFEKIVSDLGGSRDPARHPIFDVAYTHQNAPAQVVEFPGLTSGGRYAGHMTGIAPGTAKFDLTLGVVEQGHGAMHGYVEYAVALFDRGTATRLADWFTELVDAVTADPARPLGTLRPGQPPLEVRGRAQSPVWHQVERYATTRPDHPAVVDDHGAHTYRQLNRMINRLARRLADVGVTAETRVPVFANRDVDLVVGWLAVAKAGGAFVPVDPTSPRPRVDAILSDIGASAVVLGRGVDTPSAATTRIVVDPDTDESDDAHPAVSFAQRQLAYVCYTSGSSGRPHGCETEHGQLTGVVRWYVEEMELTGEDRILQGAWPSFDTAIMEVFAALDRGATLQLADSAMRDPGSLLDWMARHGTTAAFLPTPVAEVLLTEVEPPTGLRLRVLSTGGDQLRVRPTARLPFRLLNMYGPTECTIVATAGNVTTEPDMALPDIGVPVSDTVVHLLDDHDLPVPDGELGEVCIGGAIVGRGYHGLPGFTASRFVADPFIGRPGARMYRTGDLGRRLPDGTLQFHGRVDDQVEVRGHRVEPAEVEQVLRNHPSIGQALVIGTASASGGTRLVAHVVPRGPAPDEPDLIAWVAAALPAHMVPDRVVITDTLPTTANGKLDRKRARQSLQPPPERSPLPATGADPAEQVLAGICADLLAVGHVDPHDNFFELGGDSLLGIRLGTRAAKAGIHFTPQDLLLHPTLRELAAASTTTTRHIARDPADHVPLSPTMHMFLAAVPGGMPDFVEAHVLESTQDLTPDMLRTALRHLVGLHEPLRYRLRHNSLSRWIECAVEETTDLVDVTVLPAMTVEQQRTAIQDDLSALATTIDPGDGPVLRARYYERDGARNPLVLLLVHHFVFDNLSSVVLLDDLDTALTRPASEQQPIERVPAWRHWTEHLHDIAGSDALADELPYWTTTLRTGGVPAANRPTPTGGGSVHRDIPLDSIPPVIAAGGQNAQDAALCALACGVSRWRGTPGAHVMVEGDATPNPHRPLGRPASIGWFTSLHPLVLPVDPASRVGDCLPAVADSLRAVPHDGVGYGILRHLSPHSAAVAELRSLPEPEIMLAHQGNDGTSLDSGFTRFTVRPDLYPESKRSITDCFPLVLLSAVREHCVSLSIMHDGRFTRTEVEALMDEVARAFTELAEVST
ncbi:non-ribosomal peptide synthetase [Umezawaea sp. Da 62-37]|uniref:non-ribosomal peptide synthetase n=1 Tax=Umezawaea sp. Da 62-37 TaxID=3075927 RepID=UPI0028F6D8BD|nr:non-ribosomal peptide synthetase [Umezawaea sp. Da 62-37]WNV85208.1 amino acid adenylation domain-containing protein [Umezawaea sp. Da 62-37]